VNHVIPSKCGTRNNADPYKGQEVESLRQNILAKYLIGAYTHFHLRRVAES